MNIRQNKASCRTNFSFESDRISYSVATPRGKTSFSVEYASIPYNEFLEIEERTEWFKNVGMFLSLVGIGLSVMRWMDSESLSSLMWIPIGICFILLYIFRKVAYTVIDTECGRIFVIQDKKHDLILDKIAFGRKSQWREWYGAVNIDADPGSEIKKFKWLLEREAITPSEFSQRVSEISSLKDDVRVASLRSVK